MPNLRHTHTHSPPHRLISLMEKYWNKYLARESTINYTTNPLASSRVCHRNVACQDGFLSGYLMVSNDIYIGQKRNNCSLFSKCHEGISWIHNFFWFTRIVKLKNWNFCQVGTEGYFNVLKIKWQLFQTKNQSSTSSSWTNTRSVCIKVGHKTSIFCLFSWATHFFLTLA